MPHREVTTAGARPIRSLGRDEMLAELIASTGRCVASAIQWGVRDVGALRVLFASDETCLALHECVSHYARLLREAGESADRTAEIVMQAIDSGSLTVSVQASIRSAVREWSLEAWSDTAPDAVLEPAAGLDGDSNRLVS